MKHLINFLLLLLLVTGSASCASAPTEPQSKAQTQPQADIQPIYLVDLWGLYEREGLDSQDAQINATYFITALQGIVNREAPRLFLDASLNLMNVELESHHYPDRDRSEDFESLDRRWLEWLQAEKLLEGQPLVKLTSLREMMDTFGAEVAGLVRWDMETPASVNLALTAAGAENLLPLGIGLDDGELAAKLAEVGIDLPVKRDFTGFEQQAKQAGITGKELVYRRMLELYLKPGKVSPSHFWFNLDAYAWRPPVRSYGGNKHLGARNSIQHNGLYNSDYWVAKRGLFVDLYSLDGEAPNDDPEQTPGTDLKLWNDLLEESYRQRDGAFGVMGGFAPWWVKYSDYVGNSNPGIDAEQSFIRLATSYNLWNDADAAFGLSNASFYQHIPLPAASEFTNPPQPKRELDTDTVYVCFFMLDYDGSAWLNQIAHCVYDQEGRGEVPLNWAINPILGDRVPHVFHYLLSNRTDQDFFQIGDDGAGYIDPYYLKGEHRTGRIKKDGFEAYNRAAQPYLDRMNMDLMAFYISDQEFTTEVLAPIAPLTPAGMGLNRMSPADSVAGVPLKFVNGYHHRQNAEFENEMERLFQLAQSNLSRPEFFAYRLIVFRPYMIADPVERLKAEYPDAKIEFLDAHSFMQLKAEADKLPFISPWMHLDRLQAVPGEAHAGLSPISNADGAFKINTSATPEAWELPPSKEGVRYFYFNVDDAFSKINQLAENLSITIELRTSAPVTLGLQYNGMWPEGYFPKPFVNHPTEKRITPQDGLTRVRFDLDRPFFRNSQNGGTDFRFILTGQEEVEVRSVTVETED